MKIKYFIIAFIIFLPKIVLASPTVDITVNKSSIEKGESVIATITLTDTAAWNIKIEGNGAASCSDKQADVTDDGKNTIKVFNLECISTSEGTITFNVTGDITSESAVTEDISLKKVVIVSNSTSSKEEDDVTNNQQSSSENNGTSNTPMPSYPNEVIRDVPKTDFNTILPTMSILMLVIGVALILLSKKNKKKV